MCAGAVRAYGHHRAICIESAESRLYKLFQRQIAEDLSSNGSSGRSFKFNGSGRRRSVKVGLEATAFETFGNRLWSTLLDGRLLVAVPVGPKARSCS